MTEDKHFTLYDPATGTELGALMKEVDGGLRMNGLIVRQRYGDFDPIGGLRTLAEMLGCDVAQRADGSGGLFALLAGATLAPDDHGYETSDEAPDEASPPAASVPQPRRTNSAPGNGVPVEVFAEVYEQCHRDVNDMTAELNRRGYRVLAKSVGIRVSKLRRDPRYASRFAPSPAKTGR